MPTPDRSTSGDIPRSVLQAQATCDSIINSTLKSFKIATGAPHKLNTTSADPNGVTFKESIIPTIPQPTDKPNVVETTTPVKRAPDDVLTPPPDIKRVKTDMPLSSPGSFLPSASASSRARSPSLEIQLTEKRKQLESIRKSRAEMAKKRSHVEERLAPHKQRMAEELERLKQEEAEEKVTLAEEEESYKASQALLAEFEGGDSAV
jgi:hypothetical protein